MVYHNYSTALIFEDDIKLIPNFKNELVEVMNDLPPDWEYVNLGSSDFFTKKLDK
jgi:GR25 family glycosyltransferase involved in LPS biosynthesis